MASDWIPRRLGDLVETRYGKALAPEDRGPGDAVVFGTNGPTGTTTARLGEGPTIVIGRKGAYRGVVWSPGPFWVIDTAFYLVPRQGVSVDLRWLFRALSLVDINAMDAGSAIPSTRREDLEDIPLNVPSIPEQRAIADVLSALDDKIASNRLVADTAARTMFAVLCRWLANAKSTKKSLASIARFVNGRNFTRGASGQGRPVLRIKELRGGVTPNTVRTERDAPDDYVARRGDLLFAWSGTLGVHRWVGEEALVNQHIFKVIPHELPRWFVEHAIRWHLDRFVSIAADKATTMGHIRRTDLDDALVAVPAATDLTTLRQLCEPLDKLRLGLLCERRTLTAIRDALLPKLVSGQIRVPLSSDPEEQVGAAVEALGADAYESAVTAPA